MGMWQLHPYPYPIPLKRRISILACEVVCWTNQPCQISTRSVQGFRSPRWPKIAIFHWMEVSPLQQCTH